MPSGPASLFFWPLFLLTLSLLPPACAYAELKRTISLAEAVALTRNNNPLIKVGQDGVEAAQLQAMRVTGNFHSPAFDVTGYTGLVPAARGDVLSSQDRSSSSDGLGPFYRVDFTAVLPLYSFGKAARAKDAAAAHLVAGYEDLGRIQSDLTGRVVKAYAATAIGQELNSLAESMVKDYQELIEQIRQEYDAVDSVVTDADLFKAQVFSFDIEKNRQQALLFFNESVLLLNGLLNNLNQRPYQVQAFEVPTPDFRPDQLSKALASALDHSPVLRKLRADERSLSALASLEERKMRPDLFLAVGGGIARADNRDKQTNPFVEDKFNYDRIGATLGLKWNYNYHQRKYQVSAAHLEHRRLLHHLWLKQLEIEGKIRQVWLQVEQLWNLRIAADESLQAARRWVRLESENLDIGLGDVNGMVDAYKSYYTLRAESDRISLEYLHVLADLAVLTGSTDQLVDWIEYGKVVFD